MHHLRGKLREGDIITELNGKKAETVQSTAFAPREGPELRVCPQEF